MNRTRFPLYAKLLLWFFLNLVVLGLLLVFFMRSEFRWGLESLVNAETGRRLGAVSALLAAELRETPREQWDSVLERFGQNYNVQFLIFTRAGVQVAGPPRALPPPVLERLRGPLAPLDRERPGRGPPPWAGPRREEGQPSLERPPGLRPRFGAGPRSVFIRTENPSLYWAAVPLPLSMNPAGGFPPPRPLMLVAVTESLRGTGLFFDFTPWLWIGAAAVFLSALFWFPLARGITRAISQMTRATEQIAEGRFETRVESRRRDELGRLGEAINRMAGRLAGFVQGQRRFLGDIAHELCSPIARIQMALGILEQRADPRQQPYVEDLREEVQHMSSLVNELLSFSKASVGGGAIKLQRVPVHEVISRVVKREAHEQVRLEVEAPPEVTAWADPELLARSLSNLIRNAIRYAGEAGPISIRAERQGEHVVIRVADQGPGVPDADLVKIFDPFYRTDPARTRDTGGVGLGLAIVKTCIEGCQGTVSCRNRQPAGLEVTITLRAA